MWYHHFTSSHRAPFQHFMREYWIPFFFSKGKDVNQLINPTSAEHACGEEQLAAMLTVNRSAGVTPQVNLREHVTCMPLPSRKKAGHSGFETQIRYHHKFKTEVSVAPQKRIHVSTKNQPKMLMNGNFQTSVLLTNGSTSVKLTRG